MDCRDGEQQERVFLAKETAGTKAWRLKYTEERVLKAGEVSKDQTLRGLVGCSGGVCLRVMKGLGKVLTSR